MGCDIHPQIEYRRRGEDRWHWLLAPLAALPFDATRAMNPFPRERNYDFFAIIANVRNGRGFAGAKTGAGFVPASDARGIPDNLSDELRAALDEDRADLGDHSFTWVTGDELRDYWTQHAEKTLLKYGVVPLRVFAARRVSGEAGEPQEYCAGISGNGLRTISPEEAAVLLNAGHAPDDPNIYVEMSWETTYNQCISYEQAEVMWGMRDLFGWDARDDFEARFIMGFDS